MLKCKILLYEEGVDMTKIEEVFVPLIDAYDVFLDVDEKEIGCLNEREHERVLADRNYYSQLLVEKLNGNTEQLVKEHRQKKFPMIMESFGDDTEGIVNRKRKKYKIKECEL